MAERVCGTCSLCCYTLGVEELEKLPLQWCKHCKIGADHACTIYHDRPQSCRDFQCLWLTHPQFMAEELQPRKTGVVVWITADGKTAMALTRQFQADAWQKPLVLNLLRKLATEITVIAFSGTRAWLVGTERYEELPEGAVERKGYCVSKITVSAEIKARVRRAA